MKKLKLNWDQRLMISRGFHVALGNQTRPEWKGSKMFYAFKCKKHGIVTNHAKGYDQRLECPKCFKEDKD